MKIYYKHEPYLKSDRGEIFPMLKPFIKNGEFTDHQRMEMYGMSTKDIIFVNTIEESQLVIVTKSWNYYLNSGKLNQVKQFINQVLKANKPVWVVMLGDVGIPFPDMQNVTLFRASGYQSKLPSWHTGLPVFISDPLKNVFKLTDVIARIYNSEPTIGFCGLVDKSKRQALKIILKGIIKNIAAYINFRKELPQKLVAAPYLRYRCLKPFMQDNRINDNFVFRKKYRAGSKTPELKKKSTQEFFNNIIESDYVLCVRGAGNFSARLYETLAMGRIPIYVNTDGLLPLRDVIDWKKHLVWVEEHEIPNIANIVYDFHKNLDDQKLNQLFMENRKLWETKLQIGGFFKEHFKILEKFANQ